jgi:hypothetical protein
MKKLVAMLMLAVLLVSLLGACGSTGSGNMAVADFQIPEGGFDTETPVDTLLTAPHPYDRIYWLYLMAMMDYVGGNAARYENTAALFNAAYRDYGKYLKRRGA